MTPFSLLHLPSIDSTNSYLLQQAAGQSCHGRVVVAEQQTDGRGQRGRRWVAAPGDALLCSIGWQFKRDWPLDGLSLAVGVMVAEALADAIPSRLSLKWPNDLLLDGTHKLGGILIETVPSQNRTRTAVIGLGINLRTPTGADLGHHALPAAGLDGCIDGQIGRDDLLDRLLASFAAGLPIFAVQGFAPFRQRWWRLRAFAAGEVIARLADGSCNAGRVVDVTDRGALVIESADGLHTLVSGEVSLRAAGA